MTEERGVVLIGYSGHGLVAADILQLSGFSLIGYCDEEEKQVDPFGLPYLGKERSPSAKEVMLNNGWFVAIGENRIRERITLEMVESIRTVPVQAIHPASIRASSVTFGPGVMIAAGAVLNPLVTLGKGVIINTAAILDHECRVGAFSHIAPGAVLAGNVTVGERSFIGANAVIKQGVRIGDDVIIGAGSVIIRDILSGTKVAGNPARQLPS